MTTPESQEQRAAALFEAGRRHGAPLDATQLARIERGVHARIGRSRRVPTWLRALFGAGALLGGSLVFAAVWSQRARAPEQSASAIASRSTSEAAEPELAAAPDSSSIPSPVEDLRASPAPVPGPPPVSPPEMHERSQTPPASEAATAAPSKRPAYPVGSSGQPGAGGSLLAEAKLLEEAVHALRTEKDAAAALRHLSRYRQRFPDGQLMIEAQRTRIEAHVALGQLTQALRTVRAVRRSSAGSAPEWSVLEGELLIRQGRCNEALDVFTRVLAVAENSAARPVFERAWYGRVSCHSKRGDSTRARTDAAEYLRRYPDGRFSAAMRTLLGR